MADDPVRAAFGYQMIRRFIDDIERAIGSLPWSFLPPFKSSQAPTGKQPTLKAASHFIDLSILEIAVFAVASGNKVLMDKYRFHYMDAKGKLFFRYDNAAHYPDITSFPHHKHLPARVVSCSQPTVGDVLNEINAVILAK